MVDISYTLPASNTLDKLILQDLDASATTDDGQLGMIVTSTTGRRFKKVLMDASCVATSAGYPAYYMVGTTSNEVTSDYSDAQVSERLGATFAGVFCKDGLAAAGAVYVWIEIPCGQLVDANVSSNVGVSDGLKATDDGFFDISTSDSDRIVAVAMEAYAAAGTDILLIA